MPTCTVMVGLPACGKSTLIDKMIREMGDHGDAVFVYSTDRLIEEWAAGQGWSYDFAFSKYIDQATSEMNRLLDEAIRERVDIVWDQTNLSIKKRLKILNRMKNAGYQVECICIRPPEPGHLDDLKAWKQRLNTRPGKTIPEHIIQSMYQSYVEPTLNEGFDNIAFYSIWGLITEQLSK